MEILSDEQIRQVYNKLKIKPPDWIPEIDKAVAKAQQKDTLKQVMEKLEALCEFRHEQCQFVINDFGKWTKWVKELEDRLAELGGK